MYYPSQTATGDHHGQKREKPKRNGLKKESIGKLETSKFLEESLSSPSLFGI